MALRNIALNLWNLVSPLDRRRSTFMNPPSATIACGSPPGDAPCGGAGVARLEEAGGGDRRCAPRHRGLLPVRAARSALEFETADQGQPRAGGLPLVGGDSSRSSGSAGANPPPPPAVAERRGRAGGRGACPGNQPPPHLADRTAFSFGTDQPTLGQIPAIRASIRERSGHGSYPPTWTRSCAFATVTLHLAGDLSGAWAIPCAAPSGWKRSTRRSRFLDFSRLLCRIIDFKERVHGDPLQRRRRRREIPRRPSSASPGRSAVMFEIRPPTSTTWGKLATLRDPGEAGPPDAGRWGVMRTHAYYTYQILNPIEVLNLVSSWSSAPPGAPRRQRPTRSTSARTTFRSGAGHGGGGLFTAITENRPYRKGMTA